MSVATKKLQTKTSQHNAQDLASTKTTFLEHIVELQTRFFWIIAAFVIGTIAAYPFFEQILAVITYPLEQKELVYLTPVGGFGFIIKVCMLVGGIFAMPVAIYHLIRYLSPVVGRVKTAKALVYMLLSFVLACIGIAFAYFISLPAALYFLTGFELETVSAMLTADSYFGFISAYIIVAAAIFQLPLIMMIIDSINTLPPKKLMNYQRHVIVGAFVMAAIVSPTPDIMNQAFLAGPMVAMYQVGVLSVYVRAGSSRKQRAIGARGIAGATQPQARHIASLIDEEVLGFVTQHHQPAMTANTKEKKAKAVVVEDFAQPKQDELQAKQLEPVIASSPAQRPVRIVSDISVSRGTSRAPVRGSAPSRPVASRPVAPRRITGRPVLSM